MSHVTMEMSHRGSHLHNGLSSYSHHHGGVMGHMGLGSAGERVSSSHQHVACSPADDVDLDALINDMNTFPAYNEERPLLESMENLSHLQDSSSYEFCSKSASQSALNVGRTIPKPKLDWTWRSKSTSGTPVVEHAKLKLSTSLPERREQKEVAGDDEVPNPFPGLKTMGVGSAVENLYIAQKSKDKLSLTNGDQSEVPQFPIRVYCEDGTTKLCGVHPSLTVQDMCALMVYKMHTSDDKSWSLIEELTDMDLERTLEDHELPSTVFKSWPQNSNNKLHFRKDFRKYEIFQNPGQFFPEEMLVDEDDSDSPTLSCKRPKTPWLLDLLSTADKIPEIQGYLHIREGHKKSWKKMFCLLRENGLYYSGKGNSKDSRHLHFFVQFSDVNIYQATNAKKKYHAPTDYMFCIKPNKGKSETKDLKCFCAESERSRQCWLATMRFVKYGSLLRENYNSALHRTAKTKAANSNSAMKDMKICTERAAMDFSGDQGRVIDNPSEAIAIARQEGFNWRRRGGQRSFEGPSLTSPRQAIASSPRFVFNPLHKDLHNTTCYGTQPSSPRHNGGSPRGSAHHGNCSPAGQRLGGFKSAGIHMTQPWFHSGLTREQTHELFAKKGMVDGMFLVRESQRIAGAYVLSFSFNQKVKHYQINVVESCGQVFFTLDEGSTKFTDLIQLVEFYMVNAVGLPTPLLHACSSV
ncbi:growth factor receptor-bound protein 14-like isoform X2 [Acanthaster planci]|uniref:Growth factor receptor-bound protein 14-like isoform X2 n=1 Tax=Acanthaster planci TaxID=133434 RepID=A0A8B7YTK0_ACAPL|nr:growth factor receptor-bound protein 14-like isoform X2 [Acanthaster planci]